MTIETMSMIDVEMVPGVNFRPFRGEIDYPGMVEVINLGNEADKGEEIITVEEVANEVAHLENCDPYKDMLFVDDGDGRLAGYGRVTWYVNDEGERIYWVWAQIRPAWRRHGIGRAMLHWQEQRLRAIAATHPGHSLRYFQAGTMETAVGRVALFRKEGYLPVRFGYKMVRPTLDNMPDAPMPAGLEVRPVRPEHMRLIWQAMDEAFRDHWGHRDHTEQDYERWIAQPVHRPELWQVAWDVETNQVAGMVLNFIVDVENERFHQKRGWTDPICVRRPWRRRGLARALIVRSLHVLKERGMTEAALGVDADNPNQAMHLYESAGYLPVNHSITFRKSL